MTDIHALIARVRELDGAATSGPWEAPESYFVRAAGTNGRVGYPPTPGAIASLFDGEYIENPRAEQDGKLIAYYRTAAPQLADECERLAERVRVLEAALRPFAEAATAIEALGGYLGDDRSVTAHCPVHGSQPVPPLGTFRAARAALEKP